ncbi:MAG: TIGR03087 family PEP-CTERM/XrtA system glycosyltransferase [Parahaliea sp.]
MTSVSRQSLLLLCHRIPYPPNKGDKIRSYHLLRYLVQRYDVYLAAFVDDPDDWQYESLLRDMCADVQLLTKPRIPPLSALLRAVSGIEPLTLSLYRHRLMTNWVRHKVVDENISQAVVFSSAMGQYVLGAEFETLHRVIDFVDVDSQKWSQYALRKPWPLSWIYRREGRLLAKFELKLHACSAVSLFVSAAEAEVFCSLSPAPTSLLSHYSNGVDSDYFDSALTLPNPYSDTEQALVFTGAMDYWPNVDAVCWFAKEHLPALRKFNSNLVFYIVGNRPTQDVRDLANLPGVKVTGRVDDVRPYLQHCLAAVAPMRVARGIQNKVLEAMSMARPVLVSAAGLEGINAVDQVEVLLTEDSDTTVSMVKALLAGQWSMMGQAARARVLSDFNWDKNLQRVDDYLLSSPSSPMDTAGNIHA